MLGQSVSPMTLNKTAAGLGFIIGTVKGIVSVPQPTAKDTACLNVLVVADAVYVCVTVFVVVTVAAVASPKSQ